MSGGVPAGELLPCPFCGGSLVRSIAYAGTQQHPEDATWWAGCTKCDAGVDAVGERSAITAWNTRATPTPPIEGRDADVERVEVVAKAIYDATHVGLSNCYAWDDEWEPHQEARRGRYYKEAAAAIAALQALGERP